MASQAAIRVANVMGIAVAAKGDHVREEFGHRRTRRG